MVFSPFDLVSFKFSSFQFVKGKRTTIEQQSVKVRIRRSISNFEKGISFQIPNEIINLHIDPIFFNWVISMKSFSIIFCS